jgi:ATP phosphoribosyltransferase
VNIGLACDTGAPPQVTALLAAAGLDTAGLDAAPPALVRSGADTWLLAPGEDVLACCARGALDVAVVGKDLLLELRPSLPELLDLGVCRDRLVYALAPGAARSRPRIATRYPRLARRHFARTGRQVETLALGSSAALTPALGAADGVVELESRLVRLPVDLAPVEEVAACTARLVASRGARVLATARLGELVERLRTILEES